MRVKTKVDLPHGLGRAVVVESGTNLVSEFESLAAYTPQYIGKNTIKLTHDVTGEILEFKRDPARYGDNRLHLTMPEDEWISVLSFYQPKRPTPITYLTAAQEKLMNDADHEHVKRDHPDDLVFAAMLDRQTGIEATSEGLRLLREHRGPCSGCGQGKMSAQAQLPSSKHNEYKVGEAISSDIMFLDGKPSAVAVDVATGCVFVESIGGRTLGDLKAAYNIIVGFWRRCGHDPRILKHDRESAVANAKAHLTEVLNIEIELSAAGQHQALAEVNIKLIKDKMRATRCAIKDRHGYDFNWIDKLRDDVVQTIQRTPKRGDDHSPLYLFNGHIDDAIRDYRAELGEIILVHRPKRGAARDLNPKAEWAIVVERPMNGTGILGVIIIDTKRLAYRLKFIRCTPPERVVAAVKFLKLVVGPLMLEDNGPTAAELGGVESVVNLSMEGAAADELVDAEVAPDSTTSVTITADVDATTDERSLEGAERNTEVNLPEVEQPESHHEYNLRPRAERVNSVFSLDFEVQRTLYTGFTEDGVMVEEDQEALLRIMAAQIKYEQALKSENSEPARMSMKKEIQQTLDMACFHGVHFQDLSQEERRLILKSTSLYKEKYFPSGEFEKAKSRVLIRGDMEQADYKAESSSPVARMETVFWLLAVGSYLRHTMFKVDFIAAYLNTPRPEEVRHKHVWLPVAIAEIVVELAPSEFAQYLAPDGRILVCMDKLMYGYCEAGYYWYLLLTAMFIKNGYVQSRWDRCLLTKHTTVTSSVVAITVDDCLFSVDSEQSKEEVLEMCRKAFAGITYDEGDIINHLGMQLNLAVPGEVGVAQPKFVADLHAQAPEVKLRDTPLSPAFMDPVPVDRRQPCDRNMFRSLLMSCMYAGKRTFPQILFGVSVLASVVLTATKHHFDQLLRIIGYMAGSHDHGLVIRPGSLDIVVSADASHADHPDCKSHTGGAIGVRGAGDVPDCYFIFVSTKQSIVTKSSMESEIVAQDTMADWAIWSAGIRDDLVPPRELDSSPISTSQLYYREGALSRPAYDKTVMEGDNMSAKMTLEKGHGSFKKTKHILKRYFYITELIAAGKIVLKWVPSEDLVADILTKAVETSAFFRLLPKLIGKGN